MKGLESVHFNKLVKAIDEVPLNHDDRAEVIKDMIQKLVHEEKFLVYEQCCNLLEIDPSAKLAKTVFISKKEMHKEFADKWAYNTPFSSRKMRLNLERF
jgi:hypothetical protein